MLLTSPALGSPGCCGVTVARAEKKDDTALALADGVRELILLMVAVGCVESWAVAKLNREYSIKPSRKKVFISGRQVDIPMK